MFITCSAYKMLFSCDSSSSASSSNPEAQKKFWKGIWQLWVPNKMKHFVWRIYNNALPTMENLYQRHIVPSVSYALCNVLPKDSLHAVWSCEVILGVWSTLEWFHQLYHHNPALSVNYLPDSCFAERSLEQRFLLSLCGFFGISVMQSILVILLFPCLAFAVKQGVICKSFFKLKRRSLFHPVHLPCNNGALLIFIAIR